MRISNVYWLGSSFLMSQKQDRQNKKYKFIVEDVSFRKQNKNSAMNIPQQHFYLATRYYRRIFSLFSSKYCSNVFDFFLLNYERSHSKVATAVAYCKSCSHDLFISCNLVNNLLSVFSPPSWNPTRSGTGLTRERDVTGLDPGTHHQTWRLPSYTSAWSLVYARSKLQSQRLYMYILFFKTKVRSRAH